LVAQVAVAVAERPLDRLTTRAAQADRPAISQVVRALLRQLVRRVSPARRDGSANAVLAAAAVVHRPPRLARAATAAFRAAAVVEAERALQAARLARAALELVAS
jgi:hypothetical protein